MKFYLNLLYICALLISSATTFAQFTDTASLNQYIRDTIRDKRPLKLTAAQMQKAFLGVTGFLRPLDTGGGPLRADTLSQIQAYTRAQDSMLEFGKFYYILGVDDSLYGGTNILIRAATRDRFEPDGLGFFKNPDYHSGDLSIWNGEYAQVSVSGMDSTLFPGEYFLSDDGKKGRWMAQGYVLLSNEFGTWTDGTYNITGQTSGRTATISSLSSQTTYSEDQKVIWGGRVWMNKTGNTGYKLSAFELNEDDWELLPYSDPAYVPVIDAIKYDWQNDCIIGRREEPGDNEVVTTYDQMQSLGMNAIKSFQWGNPYDLNTAEGIAMQRITNGINENINFNGREQVNIEISNSYQYDMFFGGYGGQSYLTLKQGTIQKELFFINGFQYQVDFTATTQERGALIANAGQTSCTFIKANHFGFEYVSSGQNNVNLWGYTLNKLDGIEDPPASVNAYLFGPGEQEDCPDQIFVRIQDTDVSTPSESTEEVFDNFLDFNTGVEDANYAFEYELYVETSLSDTLLLNVASPATLSTTTFFTFTNLTTGEITSSVNVGGDNASLPLPNPGDEYHIRISGVMTGTSIGTIRLGMATRNSIETGEVTIKAGSFAKFSRFKLFFPVY